MLKKRKVKRILIISAILLVAILVVRGMIMDAIERANQEEKVYTTISDFQSIKEIAEYMGCTYIKEQESTGEKYDIDIYLKFKYALYTEEVSNQDYYYRMIALMLGYVNYQNIRLIDQENDIVIAVTCDKENKKIADLLINGQDNYFGKTDTKNILENYENFQVVAMEAEAPILKQLIEKDWTEKEVDFGTQEATYNKYKIYFDEGIQTKIAGKKVFHLVFTKEYTGEVIKGIDVNSDEEAIKQVLGEPDFTLPRQEVIGYRGEEFYIFFNLSYKQIGIYRRQNTTEAEKEQLKRMLAQLSIDGNATVFASDMTDMWSDYDKFEYENGYISLQYSLRGIKFEANVTENNGLLLYTNYTGSLIKELQEGVEIPYTYVIDEDLIFEIETKYEIYEYATRYSILENDAENQKFHIKDISTDSRYKELRILSVDGTHYNFDFETKVNSYVWLDENNFAYSISNQGIYRYNILTKETQIILEGQEQFKLIEYSRGYLKYDDKEILYVVE